LALFGCQIQNNNKMFRALMSLVSVALRSVIGVVCFSCTGRPLWVRHSGDFGNIQHIVQWVMGFIRTVAFNWSGWEGSEVVKFN